MLSGPPWLYLDSFFLTIWGMMISAGPALYVNICYTIAHMRQGSASSSLGATPVFWRMSADVSQFAVSAAFSSAPLRISWSEGDCPEPPWRPASLAYFTFQSCLSRRIAHASITMSFAHSAWPSAQLEDLRHHRFPFGFGVSNSLRKLVVTINGGMISFIYHCTSGNSAGPSGHWSAKWPRWPRSEHFKFWGQAALRWPRSLHCLHRRSGHSALLWPVPWHLLHLIGLGGRGFASLGHCAFVWPNSWYL